MTRQDVPHGPQAHRAKGQADRPARLLRLVEGFETDPNPDVARFVTLPSGAIAGSRAGDGSAVAAELAAADELAAKALADRTLEGYQGAWAQFNRFCIQAGEPSLPASPTTVVRYLAAAAVEIEASGQVSRDDYGAPKPGRLAVSSLGVHAAAINRAHVTAGFNPPTADPDVQAVLRGAKKVFGVRPTKAKTPIELAALQQLMQVVHRHERRRRRDRAGVVLRVLGVGAAQLSRSTGDLLTFSARGVRLRAALPNMNDQDFFFAADDPLGLFAIGALTDVFEAWPTGSGLVPRIVDDLAVSRRGAVAVPSLSRQAIDALVKRCNASDLVRAERSSKEPGSSYSELEAVLLSMSQPSLIELRDASLLLVGWAGAMRQSNLRSLRWSDFDDRGDAIAVLLRRQKNDQFGVGHVVWLPEGENALTCPAQAWRRWREAVAARLGADPQIITAESVCYPAIDRHGNPARTEHGLLAKLSKDAVGDVVKSACERAGLDPTTYGSHSLRSGFITEAGIRGESPVAIQQVTGHRSLEMILRYTRPLDLRRFSPSDRMGL